MPILLFATVYNVLIFQYLLPTWIKLYRFFTLLCSLAVLIVNLRNLGKTQPLSKQLMPRERFGNTMNKRSRAASNKFRERDLIGI